MSQSNISYYKNKFLSTNLNKLIISISLFLYFLSSYKIPHIGNISLIILFFCFLFNYNLIKFSRKEIKIYLFLITFLAFKLYISENIFESAQNFYFAFLFILFLQIFKFYSLEFVMTKFFLYFLISITIFDTLLINTAFDPFSIHKESLVHLHKYFGFYQRSPAFGGSASVSSVCLIVFASIIEISGKRLKFYDLVILLITILLLINTTGLIIFSLYLVLRNYFFKNSIFSILAGSLVLVLLFLMFYFFDVKVVEKFSYEYIKIVINLKTIGIKYLFGSTNYLNLFFGNDVYLGFTDDFMSNIISSIGFLGLLIFVLIIIYHIKLDSLYILPLTLISVGSLHYQTFFTPAGIILFTFILNKLKKEKLKLE